MGKVIIDGMINRNLRGISWIISYRDMESTFGQMAKYIKENGKIIKWMAMDPCSGLTAENILANFTKARNRAKGSTFSMISPNI